MAGRPKGRPKTGGRKVGSVNKPKEPVLEMLKRHMKEKFGIEDYDPLKSIAEIIADRTNQLLEKDRVRGHDMLAQYSHPKLSAIQVNAEIQVNHEKALDELDDENG